MGRRFLVGSGGGGRGRVLRIGVLRLRVLRIGVLRMRGRRMRVRRICVWLRLVVAPGHPVGAWVRRLRVARGAGVPSPWARLPGRRGAVSWGHRRPGRVPRVLGRQVPIPRPRRRPRGVPVRRGSGVRVGCGLLRVVLGRRRR